jgi:hypothetical protein
MDRLDATVGPENWQDRYEDWGDGTVVCRLSIRFSEKRIVTKCDVAGPGDGGDEPDPTMDRKAAFYDKEEVERDQPASTVVKSMAANTSQCALRNVLHVVCRPRLGAGSMPCALRMLPTVVSEMW